MFAVPANGVLSRTEIAKATEVFELRSNRGYCEPRIPHVNGMAVPLVPDTFSSC